MLHLRAYLLIRLPVGSWVVTTHRDLESVVNTWNQSRGTAHSAVIHVGFSRPQTDAFEELCGRFPGKMLLTGSARYVFERIGPCAPTPVGTVDGIPVFVALSGWGYDAGVAWGQSLNADANPEVTRESQWGRLSADWLNDFQVSFPSEAETLRVVGIWNDKTYLELECRLPQPLRVLAGKCRFQFLAKGQDITSPFVVVRFAPPFVLEMPLEVIDLSVRSANVFRQQGIQRVSQLIELKDQDLLRFRNLGKKSLADISQAIRKVICPEMEYPVATGGYAESEIFESDLPTPHTGTESYRGMVERGSQRFSDAIEGILESLDERDAFILRKRMAWGDKWATHQEIGDQLKLSRQRIKQIEDVILEGVRKNQIWKEKMEAVIDQALTDRDTGLPLVGLEVVDAWFAGVVETEETFALALSQFGSNRFFVVKANDFSFVTSISQPEWDAVVVQASQLLEAASSLNWTKSMARENVGALLVDRGKEFREELFVSASKDAVFSSASDGVEPKLIAFGRGIEAQVEAVLTDSDRPLHYTEIAKRLTEKGRVISPAQVAGRVQRCGLLFNRGTYGLAKHLQFSEDEVASIVEAVEELVVTSPNRQWHCSEFVEMLEESGLEVDGRLTHYTVSPQISEFGFQMSYAL